MVIDANATIQTRMITQRNHVNAGITGSSEIGFTKGHVKVQILWYFNKRLLQIQKPLKFIFLNKEVCMSERERERQIDRQTDRRTYRQTDGRTYRQTKAIFL